MRRAYDHYWTTHIADRWSPRHTVTTLDQIRPHLPRDYEDLILELGCGSGELLDALRSAGYQRLLGVDGSPEQIAAAEQHGIDVTPGDALAFLRDLNEEAAVIIAVDFLEHLDTSEILDVLRAALLRLREGGTFLARVPNPQSPFGGALVFGDITHRTQLAPSAIQQVLRISGFEEITITAATPSVFGVRSRLRRGLWRLQQRALRLAFAIEAGARVDTVFSLNYLVIARRPARVNG